MLKIVIETGHIFRTKLGPQKFVFINHPALYEEIFRPEPNYPIRLKVCIYIERTHGHLRKSRKFSIVNNSPRFARFYKNFVGKL